MRVPSLSESPTAPVKSPNIYVQDVLSAHSDWLRHQHMQSDASVAYIRDLPVQADADRVRTLLSDGIGIPHQSILHDETSLITRVTNFELSGFIHHTQKFFAHAMGVAATSANRRASRDRADGVEPVAGRARDRAEEPVAGRARVRADGGEPVARRAREEHAY